MRKLKTIYLLLVSKSYFVLTSRGCASDMPYELEPLQHMQEEIDRFDTWLEEVVNELILEERQTKLT